MTLTCEKSAIDLRIIFHEQLDPQTSSLTKLDESALTPETIINQPQSPAIRQAYDIQAMWCLNDMCPSPHFRFTIGDLAYITSRSLYRPIMLHYIRPSHLFSQAYMLNFQPTHRAGKKLLYIEKNFQVLVYILKKSGHKITTQEENHMYDSPCHVICFWAPIQAYTLKKKKAQLTQGKRATALVLRNSLNWLPLRIAQQYQRNLYIVKKYFQCATIPSLTIWVYLHSFSRCSLSNMSTSAKFLENLNVQQFKVIQGR